MAPGVRDTVSSTGRGASVSLAGLEKSYERVGAVNGVSLDIRSGEFLTLLGPSGSGKTTTLMMIAGFETPTKGDIAIDGTSVVVSSAQVAQPVYVRYAWSDVVITNLYNKEGFPAVPFRTQDWPAPGK